MGPSAAKVMMAFSCVTCSMFWYSFSRLWTDHGQTVSMHEVQSLPDFSGCVLFLTLQLGWTRSLAAGGDNCYCMLGISQPVAVNALYELAASERAFYQELVKINSNLLKPLTKSGEVFFFFLFSFLFLFYFMNWYFMTCTCADTFFFCLHLEHFWCLM